MTEGKFMVAVGAIIENAVTGKILLLQRTRKAGFAPGIWEEVSGRMKQFEELEDALHREILEETGIKTFEIIKPLTINHLFRGEKVAEKELVLIIYWVRTVEEKVTISDEHENFLWAETDNALKMVEHPGVKKDIQTYIKEKASLVKYS